MPKITYAYRYGKIVSIDEVPSGETCNCVCPACKGKLIARKGTIKAHHFAHKGGVECIGAFEASIRLAAVKVLSESDYLMLPPYYDKDELFHSDSEPLRPAEPLYIDHVAERRITETKSPDVLITGHKEDGAKMQLIIDTRQDVVWETNSVKYRKLVEHELPAISVEIYTGNDDVVSVESMQDQLIRTTANKEWIYDSELEFLQEQCRRQRAEKARELKQKQEEERQRQAEEQQRIEAEQKRKKEERRQYQRQWRQQQKERWEAKQKKKRDEELQREEELERIAQHMDVTDPELIANRKKAQKAWDILFPPDYKPEPVPQYKTEAPLIDRDKYLQEVSDADFYQNEKTIIDSGGHRWCMCKECGEIRPAGGKYNEFMEWGGDFTLNFGTCKDCYSNKQK